MASLKCQSLKWVIPISRTSKAKLSHRFLLQILLTKWDCFLITHTKCVDGRGVLVVVVTSTIFGSSPTGVMTVFLHDMAAIVPVSLGSGQESDLNNIQALITYELNSLNLSKMSQLQ